MLGVVAIVLVALYLGLFLGPSQTPRLGLDLRGGTQVILHATPLAGHKITKGGLDQAVNIIRSRIGGAGVNGASVQRQGNNDIIVSAPGASRGQLSGLDQTALLRFRQTLAVGPYATAPATTPSVSSTPAASKSATPKPSASKKKTSHDAVRGSLLAHQPAVVPQATTTPTPSPSPSASASPSPTTSPAANTPAPGSSSPDLKTVEQAFASWDCSKDPNPTLGQDLPQDYIVACDNKKDHNYKYLLAPAAVLGSEISSANASVDTTTNEWRVNLSFKSSGAAEWLKVTANAAKQPDIPQCQPPSGCNSVAIVLDGVVESAPRIIDPNGIAGGNAQITGNFSQKDAKDLANVLKYGALPLKLTKLSSDTVSATLGSAQLRGGLIAGMIGLGLVVLYSLLYYRALGFVTIASLALSGLILYAVTTELGHSALGYTLSLPGIAGFIVAVGITADSFVVFFERLRDEVREGRRLRSGVERAWPRARRTIISADAVSLLAAVVLYAVSIGDVRGFAFTLGLSTLSDLFIVFFFTKPLLTVLARRPAFDGGAAWTGVGRARAGAVLEPREV